MPLDLCELDALKLLHEIVMGLVGDGGPELTRDFTMRQLAIFLSISVENPAPTVSLLAKRLGVDKPVITRALDAMDLKNVIARRRDERDRRNVIIEPTGDGRQLIRRLAELVRAKAGMIGSGP